MRTRFLALIVPLCAAAAGWWLEGQVVPPVVRRAASSPGREAAAFSLTTIRRSGQSTERLAELAGFVRRASDTQLDDLAKKVKTWPPGTARELVEAGVKSRRPDAGPEEKTTGNPPLPEPIRGGDPDEFKWAERDPQGAMTEVLGMPKSDTRTEQVDKIAMAMMDDDPATAMEFVLQAGERKAGEGTARTWAKLWLKDGAAAAGILKRMTPFQQDTMAAALADILKTDGALNGGRALLSDAELVPLNSSLIEMAETPGKQALLLELYRRNAVVNMDRTGEDGELAPDKYPEQAVLLTAMLEKLATKGPKEAIMALKGAPNLSTEGNEAVLNSAAPHVLPQLCKAGHLEDAVEILASVKDPQAWRATFNAVLPYWMDGDPVAARAAFEAAPLTALERERWLRQPAFMLQPEK